ncbi:hypothetical protein E2C01_078739 [Portunus trituberculatus]|uniref:Uncharacterized protein n=1 Tax=Portunus trituberculatus TaxID=210409 RepID=A0A5B7INJ9_PORTR|nr:hypothetical protein [Portunus trituberculatus]
MACGVEAKGAARECDGALLRAGEAGRRRHAELPPPAGRAVILWPPWDRMTPR